jgi:hypothetical protein
MSSSYVKSGPKKEYTYMYTHTHIYIIMNIKGELFRKGRREPLGG